MNLVGVVSVGRPLGVCYTEMGIVSVRYTEVEDLLYFGRHGTSV